MSAIRRYHPVIPLIKKTIRVDHMGRLRISLKRTAKGSPYYVPATADQNVGSTISKAIEDDNIKTAYHV